MKSYVTDMVRKGQKFGDGLRDGRIDSFNLSRISEKDMHMIMDNEHSGISITLDDIKSKLMDIEPVGNNFSNILACFQ